MSNNKANNLEVNNIENTIVGENVDNPYEISRTYKLRKSTMKKLYQLKANEDDFNTKFNDILDAAILHYYNEILGDTPC